MTEESRRHHESDECLVSQSDHGNLLERIKGCNPKWNEKSGPRRLVEQTSRPDKISAAEPGSSKTSSLRGKLSLRRDVNRPGHSGKQNSSATSKTKASKEVMKAILGETTLNQSSDFKEPHGCQARLHESKSRQKLGSSLSRARSSKAKSKLTPASVHASTEESTGTDAASSIQLTTAATSDNSNTESSLATAARCNSTYTSPVRGCSVYVSKLKVSTDSLSDTKRNNEVATAEHSLKPAQFPKSGIVSPTKANSESELGSETSEEAVQDQTGDAVRKCPVCREAFLGDDATENLQQHVQMCLRQRFASSIQMRQVVGNSDDTSGDEEFARLLQQREDEKLLEERLTDSDKYFCQICQRELSHMNSTRRSQHINRCMDSMESIEQEPAGHGHQPARTVPDCPICGKLLKTKKLRELHLKKCARVNRVSAQELIGLVKVQDEVKAQDEGSGGSTGGSIGGATRGFVGGSVRGATCGSSASTTGGSVGSASFGGSTNGGASTGGLIASGDTSGDTSGPGLAVKRGRGGRNATRGRGKARGRGRRTPQVPVETQPLDDDTQVALVLSASLVQQPDREPSKEGAIAQPASSTGGAPKPPGKAVRKRKAGRKEGNKEVPLLIKRTEEERSQVLEARMADIILPPENTTFQKTPNMTESNVAKRHRQLSPWKPRTCFHLAEAAAAATQRGQRDKDQKRSQTLPLWTMTSDSTSSSQAPFYVHCLLPVVTPRKRTSSRREHAVVGPTSPRKHSQMQLNQQTSPLQFTTHTSAPSSSNVSSTFSQEGSATQALGRTVQILADLASESALPAGITQSSDHSLITASGFIPTEEAEEAEGIEDPKHFNGKDNEESMIAVNQHQMEILHNLAGLVNSKELSDLHLVTSDGSVIYAHQFIIKLRCPSLAKLLEDSPSCSSGQSRRLDLQDFSHGALLCAVEFMYSGRKTVTSSTADEVWKFAKRFSIPKLSDMCSKLHIKSDIPSIVSEMDALSSESGLVWGSQGSIKGVGQENDKFFENRGLDDLIQSLWDSSGEESNDNLKEDSDDEDDDSDGNQKVLTSQTKRSFAHKVSDTDSDTEAKDVVPDDKELDEIYEFFSTQRQRRSQRSNVKKSEDCSDAENDENAVDDKDVDYDEQEEDNENSETVSENVRRQSFTIVEQLQSNCLPESQRSQKNEVSSVPGDVKRKHLQDFLLQKRTSKRRKCDDSSKGVVEHMNSSSDLITPCFVHVKRLSNELPVSPLKDKHRTVTVGTCLNLQCNLQTGHMESREPELNEPKEHTKQCSQIPGADCGILQGADATLADVSDSIFQNFDENGDDVEMLDVSQTSNSDNPEEVDHSPTPECTKLNIEVDQHAFNQSEDLLGSFYSEMGKAVTDIDEVESCVGVPLDERGVSSSSESGDESLPNVNISQPAKRGSESLAGTRSSGHASDEEMVSDERPEFNVSEDAKEQSRDSGEDAVIDVSQDDEDREMQCVELDLEEDKGSETGSDAIQEDFSDKDRDPTPSATKITSYPPKTYVPSKKLLSDEPPAVKSLKFTFRRRDRQGDTMRGIPVRTESMEPNTFKSPAIYRMEKTMPRSSDSFASILETPAAFCAEVDSVRDSSTPIVGASVGGVPNRNGCMSLKISPVNESADDDQWKDHRDSASPLKATRHSSKYSDVKSSDSSEESGRGVMNEGSPVLTMSSKNSVSPKIKDMDTSTSSTHSNAIVIGTNQDDESGPHPRFLSDTPVRPTPDCFDADTPVIISSISPAPLSPSPPPSPTFGSICSLKDAVSDSSGPQHLDDTIVNEESAKEGSFSTRCKRKLQQDDLASEDVAPSKRPKGLASHEPSCTFIDTNLSPACTTDEDDVVLVSNEEESGCALRSSRSGLKITKTGIAISSNELPWTEHLCVGLSPTRHLAGSPSSDEEEISQDAIHDASTPRTQTDKASLIEPTIKEYSLPVSPVEVSNSQSSPVNSQEPKSWSPSRRDSEDVAGQSKPQSFTLSQKSASELENTPSTLAQNVSEDQFAYFGDDGGGYMNDFNFCSDGGMGREDMEDNASQRKSHSCTERNGLKSEGALLHKKSATEKCGGSHGNVSIRNFSSSEEDASPPRLASRLKDGTGVLSTSLQLREEAEEFGCSESFLRELKAGQVDEETVWGGVKRAWGGLDVKQSQKNSSQADKQVPASQVVDRKQPMSRESIDELYHPPAPVTPMPPYDDMNTPGLKNELRKFGVKPLPKKKARLKLKEIYSYTHQVLGDSDSDSDISGPTTFKLPSANPKRNPPSQETASKKAPTRKYMKSNQKQGSERHKASQEGIVPASRPTCPGTSASGDTESLDSDDSEYSNSRECPEGYEEDEEEEDGYLEPSQMTSANLEESIRTYIKTKQSLYEKMLCYEPLDLDKFHAELKSAGLKYSKNKLREFLDYHGITFRVITSNTNRHVRKPKQPKCK